MAEIIPPLPRPAPPMPKTKPVRPDYETMLRDEFAGRALTGMLSYPGDHASGNWQNNASPQDVATFAYTYADAMLEARNANR